MAEADATEVNIAGYLRPLESTHLAAEHPARHRRAAAIALWHIVKVAEVRDRAVRLVAEYAASGRSPTAVACLAGRAAPARRSSYPGLGQPRLRQDRRLTSACSWRALQV